MSKLYEIIEKPLTGEWGDEDEAGTGIPVLRTTNFTNEGLLNDSLQCELSVRGTIQQHVENVDEKKPQAAFQVHHEK
ncbi:hypothetical protein ACFSO0_03015, partial [Brevibacillus sp. GCM10020057]|uniref:hypothetical protein n=1 Tax=Brevibacillus sp. GCM10020057 TaxID=3317327 RepID=UPI0036330CF8